MATRKSYTVAQYRAMLASQWYTVPQIARIWHKHPSEVCRILEQCGAVPRRFEFNGWVYWQFSGLTVRNAETGQRVLFS